ncbi:transcription-repair coupling factor [bacterium]|nr:transcription-repair coupling factor [bacterium]NCQ55435.1 transcription-repair coupling factor [Candidatus Parcubacteria bacterium]NCS67797.1 transcription-repair coupling factor [Candidatus Peregrinibacteria bacterium]NCS96389.1 transcription-repair coupling factor [bacterium]
MNIAKTMNQLPFKLSLAEELKHLEEHKNLTLVNVGNTTAKSYLLAEILNATPFQNIFWGTEDEKADQLRPCTELWFGDQVFTIPAKFTFRHFYELVNHLNTPTPTLFLFEDLAEFLKQKLPTVKDLAGLTVHLHSGKSIKIYEVFERLERMGYSPAEDKQLQPGQFLRTGENLFIYPLNENQAYRVELFGDEIEKIEGWDPLKAKAIGKALKTLAISPVEFENKDLNGTIIDWLNQGDDTLFVSDDLDKAICPTGSFPKIRFTTFPENDEKFFHLNFFSVLPFYTIPDFIVDVKERLRRDFNIVILTKKFDEVVGICRENELMFTEDITEIAQSTVNIINTDKHGFVPHSFQNNERKMLLLTDREIFQFKRSSRAKKAISGMNFDLINSLKAGDYVVHLDHGIAVFEGMVHREINESAREYLKLKYAGSDRLFVPVESAEKVSKYVGDEDPKLTKLGGAEWQTLQRKIKAETEKIAGELLKIYAQRELAKGKQFGADDDMMNNFNASFPYELTPGQHQSWEAVRIDMERQKPMDRLVCGDVGFGKTEIAMRAAFKAFRSGMQCAILAPITILAEQHYQGFLKRVAGKEYGVRIELMSRFQTQAEQKKILKDLEFGLVDIVIGTHRLLSEDVKFKDLGLLIIDEEQRFGVKQKEKLKGFRTNVDILTLTATPIPRTLHMGLNKLKDVSTITTPPPGRLPVVTEVRKYNLNLIRESIQKELARGGQVYFLHNEVRTIESQAEQLRSLIPEARFIVAHGQLNPHDLEERIKKFKDGEADVLIASTIIENGIDLPNANTLFVNRAEKFGLSQLYQLRGRVGRGRTQAYAYFLYHGQKLEVDARKRLRAIVEASELGAGFQIAMKDLEIRGAGEILGANQAGAMKDAGVSHFVRMLNKTMAEIKSGEISAPEEEENVTVEIPLAAYIPPSYIPNADEKIQVYQELASAENATHLEDIKKDLRDDYGDLPPQVENLCKVIRLKMALKAAHLSGVRISKVSHKSQQIMLRMGKGFNPDQIFGLLKNSKQGWVITATGLKLDLQSLPITWYQDLLATIKWLIPEKKEKKEVKLDKAKKAKA